MICRSNIANAKHIVQIDCCSKSYQVSDLGNSRYIAIVGTVLEASFTISNYAANIICTIHHCTVFAVADVARSCSCNSACIFSSFYRTVCQDFDVFNSTFLKTSCQYSCTKFISVLHLRIVESDVLDTATISIAEETSKYIGGIDV
ncbi:unknown [Prevotella sp. CAG:386]|nr:unknown [Prevotella sp. CAG:386]